MTINDEISLIILSGEDIEFSYQISMYIRKQGRKRAGTGSRAIEIAIAAAAGGGGGGRVQSQEPYCNT